MQKHAMALGYFFLSVICVFVSAHTRLDTLLLIAAVLAMLAGLGYLLSASASHLHAALHTISEWLVQIFHEAQKPPTHRRSRIDEDN